MSGAWNDAACDQGGEYRTLGGCYLGCGASQRIGGAIQKDRRRRNLRTLRELPLRLLKPLFARRICIPMAIGMDHDVDEIGIVERGRGQVVFFIAEVPAGRPGLPQEVCISCADWPQVRLARVRY